MSGYQPFPDPFADPSIAQATNSNQPKTSPLEDFNPFAASAQSKPSEPAVLPTNTAFQPSPSTNITITPSASQSSVNGNLPSTFVTPSTNSSNISHSELQMRQEELERKAAELAAKEDALRNLQGNVPKPKNWPPLPSFLPFEPCFYQDINVEIRPEFQTIVRYAYYLWLAYVGVLLFNMMTVIILEVNGVLRSQAVASVVFFLVYTPCSYIGWFRPLYKAFRVDSSFNFMIFFFVFFCHLAFSILFALGITGGVCGLSSLVTLTSAGIGNSILGFLNVILVTANAAASVLMMTKVHAIYKRSDASFTKAQEEFFSNQHVQSATQAAMQTAARHTVNNMFAPNAPQTQNSGLRF